MLEAIRCDAGNVLRMQKTPEGYLRGDAVVSRTGVFSYQNMDGTTRYELRHPDDILTQATLDSIKQVPVTMDHPAELVDSASAKSLQIGYIGDDVRIDGPNIIASFTITDADAVRDVEAGKRGLSLGYKVSDLINEDGAYNGQTYTHRQTGTIVNHLAVVKAGRAGPAARINLDGASVQLDTIPDTKTGVVMSDIKTVAVNLDGLDYQAAPEIAKALTKETARADAAETDAEKMRTDHKAEIDTMQAKLDEAGEAVKRIEAERGDEAIADLVASRLSLLDKAASVNLDAKDLLDKSDRQIMEAVIATKYDSLDLSENSADYVSARFDAVIEAASDDKAGNQIKLTTAKRADSSEKRMDAMATAKAAQENHFNGGKS